MTIKSEVIETVTDYRNRTRVLQGKHRSYSLGFELGNPRVFGKAELYHVSDEKGKALVAKISHPEASKRNQARFYRESEISIKLDHPGIVGAVDEGTYEGRPFYIIPHAGRALQKLDLEDDQVLTILRDTLEGLAYVHGNGIVHRDVSTGNIMIGEDGHGRLLDFGLSKAVGEHVDPTKEWTDCVLLDLTGTGACLGTLKYISPEQALDASTVSYGADIFSLGTVAYELLTKKPAFGASFREILRNIMNADPKPITDFRPDLPGELVDFVHTCLEKKPSDRYSAEQGVKKMEALIG